MLLYFLFGSLILFLYPIHRVISLSVLQIILPVLILSQVRYPYFAFSNNGIWINHYKTSLKGFQFKHENKKFILENLIPFDDISKIELNLDKKTIYFYLGNDGKKVKFFSKNEFDELHTLLKRKHSSKIEIV